MADVAEGVEEDAIAEAELAEEVVKAAEADAAKA